MVIVKKSIDLCHMPVRDTSKITLQEWNVDDTVTDFSSKLYDVLVYPDRVELQQSVGETIVINRKNIVKESQVGGGTSYVALYPGIGKKKYVAFADNNEFKSIKELYNSFFPPTIKEKLGYSLRKIIQRKKIA